MVMKENKFMKKVSKISYKNFTYDFIIFFTYRPMAVVSAFASQFVRFIAALCCL